MEKFPFFIKLSAIKDDVSIIGVWGEVSLSTLRSIQEDLDKNLDEYDDLRSDLLEANWNNQDVLVKVTGYDEGETQYHEAHGDVTRIPGYWEMEVAKFLQIKQIEGE